MPSASATRVLFVDDEQLELPLYRDYFSETPDIEPLFADSAAAGLAVLDREPVDCIVSDGIETADGRQFVTAATERYPDVCTVLYSGTERDLLPVEAAQHYLRKGSTRGANGSLSTLATTIRSLTATDGARRAATDGAGEWTVLGTFSLDESADVGSTVIAALSEETGRSVTDYPPLFEVIDSDALDRLLTAGHSRDLPGDVSVEFTFEGQELRVSSDGVVAVRPADR